jgi:hypothetical protein
MQGIICLLNATGSIKDTFTKRIPNICVSYKTLTIDTIVRVLFCLNIGASSVTGKLKRTVWGCGHFCLTVTDIDRPTVSELNQTQKPIELVARAIKNSSSMNDIVLNLFGGTGTTIIACKETDRECRMMELDPKYCDVIVKRYISKVSSDEVFLVRDSGIMPYKEIINDKVLFERFVYFMI